MNWEDLKIIKVIKRSIHFGREHPLMRTHQQVFKNFTSAKFITSDEVEKESFQATFTLDSASFEKLKELLTKTVNELSEIQKASKAQGVYHLNFETFKLL